MTDPLIVEAQLAARDTEIERLTAEVAHINIETIEIGNKASQLRADNRTLSAEVASLKRKSDANADHARLANQSRELSAAALKRLTAEVTALCKIIDYAKSVTGDLIVSREIRKRMDALVSGSQPEFYPSGRCNTHGDVGCLFCKKPTDSRQCQHKWTAQGCSKCGASVRVRG